MRWTKPKFEEMSLGAEITNYVNTDAPREAEDQPDARDATDVQAANPAA